jgi:hypothetical protein
VGRRATLTLGAALAACESATSVERPSADQGPTPDSAQPLDARPRPDAAEPARDADTPDVPARPLDLGSTDARADDAVALDTAVVPDATPADLGTAPADAGTAPVDAERPVEPPRGETPLPPLPGGPRQELGVAALGARIHVLGGLDAEERPLARHEVYDTSRGAWAVARDLPVPVNHPNAAAGPDGRLWVLGFLGRRAVPDRRGFVYDPADDTWADAPSLPAGRVRGDAAVVVRGRELLLIGGSAVRGVTLCDAFDVDTGTYRILPDLPEPRDHAAAAVIEGVLYVSAGTEGAPDALLSTTWRLDEAAGQWTPLAPLPTPRGVAGFGTLDGRLVLLGGEGDAPEAVDGAFAEIDLYDPVLDRWTSLGALSGPRRAFGTAVVGGTLYLAGGADRFGTSPLDHFTAWRP